MCGICGVVGIESRDAGEAVARRMMAAMRHRGPDEEGLLSAPFVTLGMRRLSIIDLAGGSQPVWNETETLAVVYNGEIYNFRGLRDRLEKKGHRFRTRSDTEVIVHAFEEWGDDCVARLHGMFALALVEMPQGPGGPATRILLARDPLGIKPLYYAHVDGNFFFASEVRTLVGSDCVSSELCPETIPAYLLFGSVCEPLTLVQGVRSLPPGHSMSVSVGKSTRSPEPRPFWDARRGARDAAVSDSSNGSGAPVQKVRALLESAVATHLVADVPVGVFLSSGLDSTALATLASRAQAGIHTFTLAFPDLEFSEAKIARRTAKRLGTEHLELTLSGEEMVGRLDEAIAAFDQPSMDGVNTYFVSWAARKAGLKVALSGLGSDELFGGYDSFRATSSAARAGELARYVPSPVRGWTARALARIGTFGSSPDRFRKASSAFRDYETLPHPYFFTRLLFTPEAVAGKTRSNVGSWRDTEWWGWLAASAQQARTMDNFTAISWLELRSYLLNTLLRDTDAMSMRNSLEVRVPFLDTPLVEHLLSIPESAKMDTRPKALLIAALRDILPDEIVAQRKRTFTFPWEKWLRGVLGGRVAAGLADWSPALAPNVSKEFASAVWQDFLGGRTSWSRPWGLYVLNEWVKRNLGAEHTRSAPCEKDALIA
ncbi:MAG TPA: asparagine synthase (glutamine-hydrolyzing) [Candidatus Acidoferrales bacterium]|nr:asparagine synthase (glutamine-hydrolyzing) [Candidatus Acidoferrales bacterium]